ncbi:hypothetical protein TNCV_4764321 [Trichonephila clavipes]|nr:hypothetical protein TNCV_4764321 [Trichonephila clavipes]
MISTLGQWSPIPGPQTGTGLRGSNCPVSRRPRRNAREKEEIELAERKRKEEMELAERKKKRRDRIG